MHTSTRHHDSTPETSDKQQRQKRQQNQQAPAGSGGAKQLVVAVIAEVVGWGDTIVWLPGQWWVIVLVAIFLGRNCWHSSCCGGNNCGSGSKSKNKNKAIAIAIAVLVVGVVVLGVIACWAWLAGLLWQQVLQ